MVSLFSFLYLTLRNIGNLGLPYFVYSLYLKVMISPNLGGSLLSSKLKPLPILNIIPFSSLHLIAPINPVNFPLPFVYPITSHSVSLKVFTFNALEVLFAIYDFEGFLTTTPSPFF